jgi:DNA-directed RNA polymerase specialized sigma24 family protein
MDSFREVYERHYRAVYQMALFLTGVPDQAEDLAADTFVRASFVSLW